MVYPRHLRRSQIPEKVHSFPRVSSFCAICDLKERSDNARRQAEIVKEPFHHERIKVFRLCRTTEAMALQ
jgi:hypothetical protein